MKPAISIIVPAYNTREYIDVCIKAILNQTFTDFEVIIVDDGSTDGTGAICDKYASEDSRVRVIHKENDGVSAARNTGLDEARGEFVSFCDSDDYYHPQFLELLHASIVKHPEVEFVEGLTVHITQYTEPDLITTSQEQEIMLSPEDYFGKMYEDFQFRFASACTKLIRKSTLEKLRFNKQAAEDMHFCVRLFLRKEKAFLVPHVIYFYYQRPGSQLHQANMVPLFVNTMSAWKNLYFDYFKEKDELIRSFFLKRAYKLVITSINSLNSNAEIKKGVKEFTDALSQDFYDNRHISTSFKMCCRILLKYPSLYKRINWIHIWLYKVKQAF